MNVYIRSKGETNLIELKESVPYSLFKDFLFSSYGYIQNQLDLNPEYMIYLVTDHTTLDGVIHKILDIPRLFKITEDKIKGQDSFQKIVSILKGIPHNEIEYVLFAIIADAIKNSILSKPITASRVRKLYFEFNKYLKNDYFYLLSIIPLYNFRTDVEELRISKEVKIRMITQTEKEKFLNSSKDSIFFFNTYKHVIEIRHKAQRGSLTQFPPKLICHNYDEIDRVIENVLSSLRLYKIGFIGYKYIFEMMDISYIQILSTRAKLLITGLANYPYHITIEQFENVFQILKGLNQNQKKNSQLNSSISIFNSIYDRNNHYEIYVDLRYILQIIFAKNGENEQNYFKISRRLSRFVSAEFGIRLSNSNILKDFFDLYPKIINKGRLKRKDIMIIKTTEYLVRKAISHYSVALNTDNDSNFHNQFIDRTDYQS